MKEPSYWTDDSEYVEAEDATYCLTEAGQAKLRALIWEQQKKNWQFWITVITALTRVGGTIIGIISALKR